MADGIDLLEQFDGFAPLRNGLRKLAGDREHWAGIPMPLEGMPLVIEPTYPNAGKLAEIGRERRDENPDDGIKVRNVFWSWRWRCEIVVYEEDSRIRWARNQQSLHHVGFEVMTLGAADAWGIEQEARAVNTLGELLKHRIFKQYMLTGMFLETSRRSGVTYLFRRLRPTVAISTRGGSSKILCTLCLHPIAYYEGSWAGAMCPTDDVIAHLMLMRGDEAMFWRRANQHPPFRREAGL